MKYVLLAVALLGCKGDKPKAAPTPTPTVPDQNLAPPVVDGPAPAVVVETDAPATPVELTDAPLGTEACQWVGIKEASEVVGSQMAYAYVNPLANQPCLVKNADDSREVILERTGDTAPDPLDGEAVADLGERAAWTDIGLFFVVKGKLYRTRVADAHDDTLRDESVAMAKKIAARLAK